MEETKPGRVIEVRTPDGWPTPEELIRRWRKLADGPFRRTGPELPLEHRKVLRTNARDMAVALGIESI